MLDGSTTIRRTGWFVAAVLCLSACTDTHQMNGSIGPRNSTETGNPPAIDSALVALVVSRDEVHVVGEPGAVTPGGIEVEVETVASGDTKRGPVAGDGSFDVMVDGSIDDLYVLRAIDESGGESMSSEPVFLYRGGATVGGGDAGMLTCDDRAAIIRGQLGAIEERVDDRCGSNADCTGLESPGWCPGWYCGGPAVSYSGEAEVRGALIAIADELCAPFETDGCFDGMPTPDCAVPEPFACVEGHCVDCKLGECPETSCADACEFASVTWTSSFGGVDSGTFQLSDCTTFRHIQSTGGECENEVSCIDSPDCTDCYYVSMAMILNALGHPDVVAARADEPTFGVPTAAGGTFTINIDGDEIVIIPSGCGAAGGCLQEPGGVSQLRGLLNELVDQEACGSDTTPGSVCEMPFDPGEGPGTIFVYAFDPVLGACRPQVYTGTGGNDNRFDDLVTCQAACPSTASAGSCPPDRQFLENVCLECGLAGGCPNATPGCAKLCTEAADCNGESGDATWSCGGRGVCEAAFCD